VCGGFPLKKGLIACRFFFDAIAQRKSYQKETPREIRSLYATFPGREVEKLRKNFSAFTQG
jgi:hypothetical protein